MRVSQRDPDTRQSDNHYCHYPPCHVTAAKTGAETAVKTAAVVTTVTAVKTAAAVTAELDSSTAPHYLWSDFPQSETNQLMDALRDHRPDLKHQQLWLAVDVDETLVDCTQAYYRAAIGWFRKNLRLDLATHLSLSEFRQRGGTRSLFDLPRVQLNHEQQAQLSLYLKKLQYDHDFNLSLPPLQAAQRAMSSLQKQVAFYLTARPQAVVPATLASIYQHHFPAAPVVACPEGFMSDPYTWKALVLFGLLQLLVDHQQPQQLALVDDSYHQWVTLQQLSSQRRYKHLAPRLKMFLHAGVRTHVPLDQQHLVQARPWSDIVADLRDQR